MPSLRRLHAWDLTPREAMAVQRELAARVSARGHPRNVRTICGADMAIAGKTGVAAVVVMSFPALETIDQVTASAPLPFPYVPGLLSFREIPVLLAAFAKLEQLPDLVFVDGQGLIHPRRLGLACHLGLILDRPSVGCAKSLLCGDFDMPGSDKGEWSPVRDGDEEIGRAVRTRTNVKPIFVSVGHRVSLDAALEFALAVSPKYRIPEPTRRADRLAGEAKRELLASSQ